MTAKNTGEPRIALPGFGLPVNDLPGWDRNGEQARLPHAIADYYASEGITLRERRMLEFMNQITDKHEWQRKIHDPVILDKWHSEAVRWDQSLPENGDWWLSESMFTSCIAELNEKAEGYRGTGFVSVLDAEATIVKGDGTVSEELRKRLKIAVKKLEDVPERLKDWHPGSDGKVLDLVHPSLFPVVYGLTRALPTGTVPLKKCVDYIAKGEMIPAFMGARHHIGGEYGSSTNPEKAWGTFQWLPSNISFREDGTPRIDSYINNLHPQKHADLYPILEQFAHAAVTLWNECISYYHSRIRIEVDNTGREDYYIPEGSKFPRDRHRPDTADEFYEPTESDEEEDDKNWADDHGHEDAYEEWYNEHRVLIQPEPTRMRTEESEKRPGAKPIDLREDFKERGIQVIFKLANIHLTPERPTYDGGSWHVEGSLNEHICATALYYYDSDNITESHLAFRQSYDYMAMIGKPDQFEHESVQSLFGVEQDGPTILNLGSVLTRQDRLLAFPNVLQHQVQPFSLTDKSRPGHRKILAMFLIDPHIPILSTANVPPQRKDWWSEQVRKIDPLSGLAEEIFDMIMEFVEGFPISWDEAVVHRERLMAERGMVEEHINKAMENDTFSFCEH